MGLLYEMTYLGGSNGSGTLFSYDPLHHKDSIRINFSGNNGNKPIGPVIQASNGLLYATSSTGGPSSFGTIFLYNPATNIDSAIFDFNGTNGASPYGGVIQASNKLLYGVTYAGGASNNGVLFSFDLSTGKDSVLFSFNGANGANPWGGVMQASDGLLYGMTTAGGSVGNGVLYSFNLATGKDSVLLNFNNTNGASPSGYLIQANDGLLYGMTQSGGANGAGALFSFNTVNGKDSVLFSFSGPTGYNPLGSLFQGFDSLLYGMTQIGGTSGSGTLFSFNIKTGKDSVLVNFNGSNGGSPHTSLIQASDSILYGSTNSGGTYSLGVLYSYNLRARIYSVLANFDGSDSLGEYPQSIAEFMACTLVPYGTIHCFGDSTASLRASVRGAKLPVSYLWSTGATTDSISGLKAGAYNCIVTDARGITFKVYDTVTQPSQILPNPTIMNGCYGSYGTAMVNAGGGTGPYTYLWNNKDTTATIDSLKPGNDTCIVTDSKGCSVKAIAVIQQAQPLKIDSIVPVKTGCPGCTNGSITVYVSGGIPPGDSVYYIYNWGNGSDSATIHNLDTGTYSVCIYSPYGCTAGGVCDSTQVIAGIKTIQEIDNSVNVFPIPSSGDISISLKGNEFENMTLCDELGRSIINQSLDYQVYNGLIHLNLAVYPNGVYILQVINKQGLITKRIVLQK